MKETPMLFPVEPDVFWDNVKTIVEEAVTKVLTEQKPAAATVYLPQKALYKLVEVCEIFQITKPTVYEWIRQGKLSSFKVKSRRYFRKDDIEIMIRQQNDSSDEMVRYNLKREKHP